MARNPRKKKQRPKRIKGDQRSGARTKGKAAGKNRGTAGKALPRHKPDVRIDKAQRAWAARRYDEAIWFYERALQRDPNNAVLLVDLARAYALRFRYADAERLIDRACALYPDDSHLQRMLGDSYLQLHHYDRAIACFRRSLELEPDLPERPKMLYELAQMYERLHDLEVARQCAEQSLALAPDQEVLHYLLALIDRRSGHPEVAQARLHELIQRAAAPPLVLADTWYQLASMHDKAGRYDEAYQALVEAKQIRDRSSTQDREQAKLIARNTRSTLRTITPEHFQRWSEEGRQLKPLGGGLALLTSHPRSGTTLLEQMLDSHPQLISADELQVMTEVVYIPLRPKSNPHATALDVFDHLSRDDLQISRQSYWKAMEGALREPIGERILLDKNPALTGLLPLVARVFPDMKILFALRDPRDVVISCFAQQLPLNPVSVHFLTLEDTVREYARTMRTWLTLRDMIGNPWIEVRYEDTVADIGQQAKRVLDFLELPWDDAVLDYHRRAQKKHVHSPTYEDVTRPVYTSSIGRWRNYATYLEPHLETLQPFVQTFGYA